MASRQKGLTQVGIATYRIIAIKIKRYGAFKKELISRRLSISWASGNSIFTLCCLNFSFALNNRLLMFLCFIKKALRKFRQCQNRKRDADNPIPCLADHGWQIANIICN